MTPRYKTISVRRRFQFSSCNRSNVTPAMVARSATVGVAVKWRLTPRKLIQFAIVENL